MDPNEAGSSALVLDIEKYVLDVMSSADIQHPESFPPLYDTKRSEFVIHSDAPDAYTMSVTKIFPDQFASYGSKINVKEFFSSHPVHPTTIWDKHDIDVEIPTSFPFQNETECSGRPYTLLTAIYPGYGPMAPIRRNPV